LKAARDPGPRRVLHVVRSDRHGLVPALVLLPAQPIRREPQFFARAIRREYRDRTAD
jgi:hypothetical protein